MMRQRFIRLLLVALSLAALASAMTPGFAGTPAASAHPASAANLPSGAASSAHAAASVGFPTVDPSYIYDQLFYIATQFQRREAGYDNNTPVNVNGHDEFAAYWQTEMTANLQGFGAQARRDSFAIGGWKGRPATVNAFNVEVTVPGVTHPEQVVVIGCHYDGEGSSTQSANDDASGCAIELGVAKALATYWRANHLLPARTLRFVIYDAEEQGIYGSFHYINQTINGDLGNIAAMINEEQSGIGYPLRYLGKTSNPVLPTTLMMTPLTNNQVYPNTQTFTPTQVQNITNFNALMRQAAPAAFAAFRALGYDTLTYRDNQNQPVTQQIFTPQDLQYAPQADDNIGGSDNFPFGLAGLPAATFIGNYSYYDQNPPPWSYPYDQPQDTIQLMNIYASGSAAESKALELALALPGMLTTWTLAQSTVLGFAPADGKPIAAIGDIATTQPGAAVNLDASAAYDPSQSGAALSYVWNFGDGAQAHGVSTQHTWASAGDYPLTLTVSDSAGTRTISKTIRVTNAPAVIANPYQNNPQDGIPLANPAVTLPQAGANGTGNPSGSTSAGQATGNATSTTPWWVWLILALLGLVPLSGILLAINMARKLNTSGAMEQATPESVADRQRREQAVRDMLTPHTPDETPPDRVD